MPAREKKGIKKPLSPAKRHPLHPSCAGVVQLWKQTMVFTDRHDGAAEYGQNTDGPQPYRLRRHMNTLSVLRLQLLVSMISPLNMMDLLYQRFHFNIRVRDISTAFSPKKAAFINELHNGAGPRTASGGL